MRGFFQIAAALIFLPAAYAETAFDAIKELPKDQAARIARIEGRDGTPDPDRWYILTQDPKADNGVHEFVVSNGKVLASRSISQFADSLTPGEMLGATPLGVDSDVAAKLAHAYAAANGTVVSAVNYELKKDGTDGTPQWTVSCVDDKGDQIAEVVVTADKGDVVSHPGFTLDPPPKGVAESTAPPDPETEARAEITPETAATSPAPTEETEDIKPRPHHHKTPPPKKESGVVKTFKDLGRTLEKYIPF